MPSICVAVILASLSALWTAPGCFHVYKRRIREERRKPHHVLLMGLHGPVGVYPSEGFMSIVSVLGQLYRGRGNAHAHAVLFNDDV